MENKIADWIAWVLHFVVGAAVAVVIGAGIFFRRNRLHGTQPLISEDFWAPYLIGAALVGGGVASLLGDKLWIGLNYRMIPPDGVQHSLASKVISLACLVVGAGLIAYSVIFGRAA
jgi:hypothetical protein